VIELGHTRIAFISGGLTTQASIDRLAGVTAAMAAAGLGAPVVRHGDYRESGGHAVGRELLAADDRPTAVIAANDRMAIGVMAAASDLGLDIPRQLSVVGFDNLPVSRFVRPSLTTVESSGVAAGREAMRVVLSALAHETTPTRIVMPCELIVRQSTGPAR
jgi:DNA-binding LacI/PurR family transcriptional regulator